MDGIKLEGSTLDPITPDRGWYLVSPSDVGRILCIGAPKCGRRMFQFSSVRVRTFIISHRGLAVRVSGLLLLDSMMNNWSLENILLHAIIVVKGRRVLSRDSITLKVTQY